MFHKHKFNYRTNLLWCECGAIKKLTCMHDWQVHAEQQIINAYGSNQTRQILKCVTCGEMKSINLTTGEIKKEN